MTYSDKLKNPKWQRKRLEILKRDDFTCKYCGDKETELHVNHKSYNGSPWEVADSELETVCKHCHLLIHEIKTDIIKVYKYFYDDCNIWCISVMKKGTLICFLYDENNPIGLQEAGVFSIDCFNELHNFINNG